MWFPLDLIKYPPDLEPSFNHLFSKFVIVSNIDLSKHLFAAQIQRLCVAKDGTMISNSGVMEGGYSQVS